jgi:hypothetical protein
LQWALLANRGLCRPLAEDLGSAAEQNFSVLTGEASQHKPLQRLLASAAAEVDPIAKVVLRILLTLTLPHSIKGTSHLAKRVQEVSKHQLRGTC